MSTPRSAKLSKIFADVICGAKSLRTQTDGELFLEATSIQSDASGCLQRITLSTHGLPALQYCLQLKSSAAFLNGPVARLLAFLQEPMLKLVDEGNLLRGFLIAVTSTVFWSNIKTNFLAGTLSHDTEMAFGWLLLELCSGNTPHVLKYRETAEAPDIQKRFLDSPVFEMRALGQKVKHLLASFAIPGLPNEGDGPGGRHDNDHVDYREISIMPTADELLSKDDPFLLLAEDLEERHGQLIKPRTHYDHQFRLLREDMVSDLREETQVILGKAKGRHKGMTITGLSCIGIHCGEKNDEKVRLTTWGIQLQCQATWSEVFKAKIPAKERRSYLQKEAGVLRHQNLACLLINEEIVAFPAINRDLELLTWDQPVIIAQLIGRASALNAMTKLKTAKRIKLVMVDTAVFAVEPVLQRLQEIEDIPLAYEFFEWTPGSQIRESSKIPESIISKLTTDSSTNLKNLLQLPKPVRLGPAQSSAFLMGLNNRVSLIQGPPELEQFESFEALSLPAPDHDGMTTVGRTGRGLNKFYLLDRWSSSQDAGIFAKGQSSGMQSVWKMSAKDRRLSRERWVNAILQESAANIVNISDQYNKVHKERSRLFDYKHGDILEGKRIIACTTTAAAKYSYEVQTAKANVLLVEEAGEILESHTIAALGPSTKQAIFIGDHKQLRPKISKYGLSVEKGDGYDLNRSLFERLFLKGYPHATLSEQYRMRPEISALVRHLTYPDLIDASSTSGRPDLRGFRSNLIFVNHDYLEEQDIHLKENMPGSTKCNQSEAQLVLNCVRYLLQNGYDSEEIVLLTPYLGQLKLLRQLLSIEVNALINELDAKDLARAGLEAPTQKSQKHSSIRLATIDNYQGEESKIIIASLTRNNAARDIGFMSSPERLNVLLSRARNALIMTGNVAHFKNARKGKETWNKLFSLLEDGRNIFDGLPVKCERHPSRIANVKSSEDFANHCPDGGCQDPCGMKLNCNVHDCPRKCHPSDDHSTFKCLARVDELCKNSHIKFGPCWRGPPNTCRHCEREKKEAAEKLKTQQKKQVQQQEHDNRIAELDARISIERDRLNEERLRKDRQKALERRAEDLKNAEALTERALKNAKAKEEAVHTPVTKVPTTGATPGNPPPPYTEKAGSKEPQAMPLQPKPSSSLIQARAPSPAELEWKRRKVDEKAENEAIDEIMTMIGLEELLNMMAKVEAVKRQNANLHDERFRATFLGNPGTGKTTVARLYGRALTLMEVLPGLAFFETTGTLLASEGVRGAKGHINDIIRSNGGVFFVDEAYQLADKSNHGGKHVLEYLLAEIENNVGTIAFVFAGYKKEMEAFFESNPGLPSRIPYTLPFEDYTDHELLHILQHKINKKYDHMMKVEDGMSGLYMRIVATRLARNRGRKGFGNARAVENNLSRITERQADRLEQERIRDPHADDFKLSKEDLIGPDPSQAIDTSIAWTKLQEMIGLENVKDTVRSTIDIIKVNYKRELDEKQPLQLSLNRVFLGSPGTGKTTVAKLYGQILVDLGMLSNGEVVVKNPADFIGAHLGSSETQTKAILATTVGKVLVIDEAYMLYTSGTGSGNHSDSFRTAVIDTIVAEVQSVPGEDRCVLLLGYEDQMREMFKNVNPGMSRRFAIDDAFHFQDFTQNQLAEIFDQKLKIQDLEATQEAKETALEVLGRSRRRPNFGNAGEVENLVSKAKPRHQQRQKNVPAHLKTPAVIFEPQDFDPDWDRGAHAVANCRKLFEDVIGCEDIVSKLEGFQQIAKSMKQRGVDFYEHIPTNFVFKGPPGTGKTTTARKMGQIYYDMGFLSAAEVIECSATDLVGQYIGHTGPKTVELLKKALGNVLFIDEAYRLGEGHFAGEAVSELVDQITKPQFAGKLIIILAGYDQDMDRLMNVNQGLSSRFSEQMIFRGLTVEESLQLLSRDLSAKSVSILDLEPDSTSQKKMPSKLRLLTSVPDWGNARDVRTLAKTMIGFAFRNALPTVAVDEPLTIAFDDAVNCIEEMMTEREIRAGQKPRPRKQTKPQPLPQATSHAPTRPPPPSSSSADNSKHTPEQPGSRQNTPPLPEAPDAKISDEENKATPHLPSTRDSGVSDEVWRELQSAQLNYLNNDDTLRSMLKEQEDAERDAEARMHKAKERIKQLELEEAAEAARQDEIAAREARERVVKARARLLEEVVAKKRAEEEFARVQKEAERERKVRAKLQHLGQCVQGFAWIKISGGYRCTGGSHYVGDAQLGAF
ncbi:hypothetical protein MMC25_005296 [Agyrium rufum]|nr:hypothetical protein [Agyrium rufum]